MVSIFRSDKYKIMNSKAFRLLKHKTQVVTAPTNPYIRNRETHVLEVVTVSGVIAEVLGLNAELVEAIAYGHDIGHVPFGHPGEHYLAKRMGKPFCHEILGPLVAQKIERRGAGLNLAWETLNGMKCHSGSFADEGATQEAQIVRWGDKIAYLFADFHDIEERMLYPIPRALHNLVNEFGSNHRERCTVAQAGLVIESAECGRVSFSLSPLGKKFKEVRDGMMDIYPRLTEQKLEAIIEPVLQFLEGLNVGDPYLLFALMTDADVIHLSKQTTMNMTHLRHTALEERLPYLEAIGPLDLCNPYMDW